MTDPDRTANRALPIVRTQLRNGDYTLLELIDALFDIIDGMVGQRCPPCAEVARLHERMGLSDDEEADSADGLNIPSWMRADGDEEDD